MSKYLLLVSIVAVSISANGIAAAQDSGKCYFENEECFIGAAPSKTDKNASKECADGDKKQCDALVKAAKIELGNCLSNAALVDVRYERAELEKCSRLRAKIGTFRSKLLELRRMGCYSDSGETSSYCGMERKRIADGRGFEQQTGFYKMIDGKLTFVPD